MTASIDVSNPAALQRFWRSVTATLRKVNPARGVLFMNAKILGEPNGKGIVIQFGKDGGFAYNAAQKTEVQELLAKTIAQVAGGTVPYRLSIEGGAAPSAPAAQRPSRPARSFVPPAPAAASASQRPAPRQQPNTMAGASGSVGVSVPPANPAATPAPTQPAASAPVEPPIPAAAPGPDPVPYEEVPLDVYGASVPAYLEDDGAYDAAPFQSEPPAPQAPAPASPAANPQPAAPAVQSRPAATPQSPSEAERSFGSPAAQSGHSDQPTRPNQPASPASGNPAAQAAQGAPRPGESEADQIKSILINSFGPGVKFEELPE